MLVTRQAVHEGGSKVGVLPLGKRVRLESMLYGLLLPSGNDAAVALAQHVAGNVNRVRRADERRGGEAGAGLHALLLALGLLRRRTTTPARPTSPCSPTPTSPSRGSRGSSTPSPRPSHFPIKGGKLYLYNNNPLLRYGYPGVTGLKTG